MQDNWYDTNDSWYSPNSSYDKSYAKTSSGESTETKETKRRSRIKALVICLAVLAAAAGAIFFFGQGSSSQPSSAEVLPKNWQDYMDGYYKTASSEVQEEISVPRADVNAGFSLSLSQNTGNTLSAHDIYAKCAPSIVCLTAADSDNFNAYSWGTGIIISADGYILTNTHIIAGCNSVSVELSNGDEYEAKLVGADEISDISILKIEAEGLVPAEFATSSSVSVGDEVVAIGNPLGKTYRLTMTDGIISGISRQINHNGTTMNLLQTNAAINEGNSGGALINRSGQIIGITNMKIISSTGVEGIGFAIPSDTVKAIADSLLENGVVTGRETIGITIGPIPQVVADYYSIPSGLYVSIINEKSDAYAQGIRVGDIITHANGQEVHENAAISAIKDTLNVGDSINFTIWRDGKTFDATVKLMDANDLN